jgi:hypothetical protein
MLDWKGSLLRLFLLVRRIGDGLGLCHRHQILISGGILVDQLKRYEQGVMLKVLKASEDQLACTTSSRRYAKKAILSVSLLA